MWNMIESGVLVLWKYITNLQNMVIDSGVSFVEIYKIFAMQGTFLCGIEPRDLSNDICNKAKSPCSTNILDTSRN